MAEQICVDCLGGLGHWYKVGGIRVTSRNARHAKELEKSSQKQLLLRSQLSFQYNHPIFVGQKLDFQYSKFVDDTSRYVFLRFFWGQITRTEPAARLGGLLHVSSRYADGHSSFY